MLTAELLLEGSKVLVNSRQKPCEGQRSEAYWEVGERMTALQVPWTSRDHKVGLCVVLDSR